MASKKPYIQIRTDQDTIIKFQHIADEDNRSMSNLGETLIKKHIAAYEKENGSIDTTSSKPQISINKVEQNGPGTINIG